MALFLTIVIEEALVLLPLWDRENGFEVFKVINLSVSYPSGAEEGRVVERFR